MLNAEEALASAHRPGMRILNRCRYEAVLEALSATRRSVSIRVDKARTFRTVGRRRRPRGYLSESANYCFDSRSSGESCNFGSPASRSESGAGAARAILLPAVSSADKGGTGERTRGPLATGTRVSDRVSRWPGRPSLGRVPSSTAPGPFEGQVSTGIRREQVAEFRAVVIAPSPRPANGRPGDVTPVAQSSSSLARSSAGWCGESPGGSALGGAESPDPATRRPS